MKNLNIHSRLPARQMGANAEIRIQGYPQHSSKEDFYNQYHLQLNKTAHAVFESEETDRNVERSIILAINSEAEVPVLMMPGSGNECDDFLENAISDDEENRFYNYGRE